MQRAGPEVDARSPRVACEGRIGGTYGGRQAEVGLVPGGKLPRGKNRYGTRIGFAYAQSYAERETAKTENACLTVLEVHPFFCGQITWN